MATVAFCELTKDFSEERQAHIAPERRLLLMEYDLVSQLRKDGDLTQQEFVALLEIRQAAVSKLEHQEDILVRTLEKYV